MRTVYFWTDSEDAVVTLVDAERDAGPKINVNPFPEIL